MLKKESFILFVLTGCAACMAGPYAPAAGQPGSTAIAMPADPNDTSVFAGWADGWTDYIIGVAVDTEWQTPAKALGPAEGDSFDIVCLGRGGQITMTFSTPIADGPGWDFATFENSINDVFLELGYVEVSSDGVHFVRFDNHSLTVAPVSAYGGIDPTDVTGYCSKYRQGYGTPFDLADLAGAPMLDITCITHVRIVDIAGDGTYLDSSDNPIYDPYPAWGSAGVDLDAIGVIHQKTLQADITGDGVVNFEDYRILSQAYLSNPSLENWNYKCDLAPFVDDQVDSNDLRVFMSQWLSTEKWHTE